MHYRLREVLTSGLWLLFIGVALTGCAGMEDTPKTAAGGAVIGGMNFKNSPGDVVGELAGGLAGGKIGKALEHKQRGYEDTSKAYNYDASKKKTVIRVEKVDIDPPSLRPGERVNLVVQYVVLAPDPNQVVTVTERWNINRGSQVAGSPVNTVQRESGTWSSAIPITLSRKAEGGSYRATVNIEVGDEASTSTKAFTVKQ